MMSSSPKDRLVARPVCAKCGRPATFVELVPPGLLPHDFDAWHEDERSSYNRSYGDNDNWHFIYRGVDAGNGYGDDIGTEEAARIARGFTEPYTFANVHTAGLHDDAGFCQACDAPYCYTHWHDDTIGIGRCPRGHFKSLDPHWSPG